MESPQGGFTLIELILVIGMIAFVAAITAPRLLGQNAWESFFVTEIQAALRYAGNLAVSSGCRVRVTIYDENDAPIAASGPGRSYDLSTEGGALCNDGVFSTPVFNPANNNQPYEGEISGTLTFTSTQNPIYVDPLGRFGSLAGVAPNVTVVPAPDATPIVLTVGTRTLSISGQSGYVEAN